MQASMRGYIYIYIYIYIYGNMEKEEKEYIGGMLKGN